MGSRKDIVLKTTMGFLFGLILLWPTTLMAQSNDSEEEEKQEDAPLRITIKPVYDKFDGTFSDGSAQNAPRIETSNGCPRDQILSCNITGRFWKKSDQINSTVALAAYEKAQEDWNGAELGTIIGGRFANLPDYLVLASFGVDPGLDPLDPFPQATGQMYGSLWFADTMSLGDRMGGPVMLAKNSKNWIKRYNGNRGICIGVC